VTDPQAPTAPAAADYAVKVLLVDDQKIVGESVRRALATQADIQFRYCGNPAEAVGLAGSYMPTVILQDLVMPGVDGLTLVRQYRANPATQDIPIIVLSTKEEPTIKSEAFALGASDYLIKLPDAIELIARVRHHSRAYLNQVQRDAAYLALHESQRKLMEINAELQRLTHVDGLTGLSNRRYFDEFIDAQWKLATREATPLSMLMIDVDNFKRYNDTYGHLAGDEVLKAIAGAMRKSFARPTDLTARFGGEEFVVVLPATPPEALPALGERLLENVAALNIAHTGSPLGVVSVSIGGATKIPATGEDFVPLMENADSALYEAKGTGKNRVVTRSLSPHATL
jgi:two-component system chemotaxis family response regulator WspR